MTGEKKDERWVGKVELERQGGFACRIRDTKMSRSPLRRRVSPGDQRSRYVYLLFIYYLPDLDLGVPFPLDRLREAHLDSRFAHFPSCQCNLEPIPLGKIQKPSDHSSLPQLPAVPPPYLCRTFNASSIEK